MISPIKQCHDLRVTAANIVGNILSNANGKSEHEIAELINTELCHSKKLLTIGWYDPPPSGIGMLFGNPEQKYSRLDFDTLRKSNNWPSDEYICGDETVGIVHVSPASENGIIADWGCSFYRGSNNKIKQHMVHCLETVEKLAEYSEVGMKFSDISRFNEKLFKDERLANNFIILTNHTNNSDINSGHTVPFADTPPSSADKEVFASDNIEAINKVISNNRLFVSGDEDTLIPKNIAFTAELRLKPIDDPSMPNIYFHTIVSFEDGKKTIVSNFNEFFEAMGMDYIHSKY